MASIQASVGRGGSNRTRDVTIVQNLLNNHIPFLPAAAALVVSGRCDPATQRAIETFQQRIVRLASPDSRVDPGGRTLMALNQPAGPAQRFQYPVGPQEPLADLAMPYLGATEARGNRMGEDPRMREIFEADRARPNGETDGYYWCAAFVSLCVEKLIRQHGIYGPVRPPRTAGVRQFYQNWAPAQQCLVFTPGDRSRRAHRGDVVIYQRSHIGIVVAAGNGNIKAIEGNTNAQGSNNGTTVRIQLRSQGEIRCFIRLPIPLSYDISNQVCTPQIA